MRTQTVNYGKPIRLLHRRTNHYSTYVQLIYFSHLFIFSYRTQFLSFFLEEKRLRSPGKHQRSKLKKPRFYVGRLTTVHNRSFSAHTLCMNYLTDTFLLVSYSVWSKNLLSRTRPKNVNRNLKQWNLKGFITIIPLLNMIRRNLS